MAPRLLHANHSVYQVGSANACCSPYISAGWGGPGRHRGPIRHHTSASTTCFREVVCTDARTGMP
jgi:hypothetical protein